MFCINTRGKFFVAREAYKNLQAGGRIILTSSNTASRFFVPKHSVYSGSKGAIESFVPVLAKDCGKKKITINAVAPGGTVTDMFHEVAHHYIPGGDKMSIDQLKEVITRPSPFNLFHGPFTDPSDQSVCCACISTYSLRLSHRRRQCCGFSREQGR